MRVWSSPSRSPSLSAAPTAATRRVPRPPRSRGALPHLTHSGPGRNRYDDPLNAYGVRYVAENLTGALLETMARFRAVPTVQSRLAAVIGVEGDRAITIVNSSAEALMTLDASDRFCPDCGYTL